MKFYIRLRFFLFIFLFSASLAMADSVTRPHTFSPGTMAKSSEVNENFDTIYEQVNKIGSVINVDSENQRIGIGTDAPEEKIDVDGSILLNANIFMDKISWIALNAYWDKTNSRWEYRADGAAYGIYETGDNNAWSFRRAVSGAKDSAVSWKGFMTVYSETGNIALAPSEGYVGIGTTSPGAMLDVHRTTGPVKQYIATDDDNYAFLYLGSDYNNSPKWGGMVLDPVDDALKLGRGGEIASTSQLVLKVGGNVGVGTTNPDRKLTVNGDAGGATAWYNDSDERLKKNVSDIENALKKVRSLRGVQFEWKDTENHPEGRQIGFIAQEAIDIVPEVIDKKGEFYSMQYAPLTALLVEAVKELKAENEALKAVICEEFPGKSVCQ